MIELVAHDIREHPSLVHISTSGNSVLIITTGKTSQYNLCVCVFGIMEMRGLETWLWVKIWQATPNN